MSGAASRWQVKREGRGGKGRGGSHRLAGWLAGCWLTSLHGTSSNSGPGPRDCTTRMQKQENAEESLGRSQCSLNIVADVPE